MGFMVDRVVGPVLVESTISLFSLLLTYSLYHTHTQIAQKLRSLLSRFYVHVEILLLSRNGILFIKINWRKSLQEYQQLTSVLRNSPSFLQKKTVFEVKKRLQKMPFSLCSSSVPETNKKINSTEGNH